jgi:TolB-like protein/DNA-binding winged helix-turn-helix (wHTH) protein
MKGPSQSRSVVHFGVFHVDLRAGELSKNGVKVRLQEQPFQILALLLEHAGEIVSREELRQRLWPADTFVDFDHSLGTAINKIREALGDSADNPRFVETLARRGYRFIAPVSLEPEAAPAATTRASFLQTRWFVLALAVVLSGTVYFAWHGFRQRLNRPTGKVMLAVLPFDNLSANPEQDYFSDGLTEEMIAQLGNLEPQRLGVIARASAMQYKHSPKGAAQIGRELGVDYLLEGSARRADGRVRITAQLIQVSDQTHLWAESYERDLRDILVLQRDVAAAIAQQIRLALSADTRARLAQQRPVNPEAHEAYLKGLYFWNKLSVPGLLKSREYFQQAIDKDPGYAQGYAGLAASYGVLGNMGMLPPREAYPKARAAAKKALEIDEGLSDAHGQLGWEALFYERDWTQAEREFRRAIALNPSNANARDGLAMYLAALGRLDGAVAEIRRARDLDPLSLVVNGDVGMVLFFARQYDQALDHLQKTREMDPNFPPTYWHMARVYEAKGMPEEAYQMYLKSMTLAEGSPKFRAALEQAHAEGGWRRAWQKATDLARQHSLMDERAPLAFWLAEYSVRLGDKDQALDSLLKAADERFYLVVFAKADPRFDGLRSDPRFAELLRRIGLPP